MPRKADAVLPQMELEQQRDATPGFEPKGSFGFIRYLEHGFPNALVRWHYHDEYELHLIVETSGKVFVGDYIGQFAPGGCRSRGGCGAAALPGAARCGCQ